MRTRARGNVIDAKTEPLGGAVLDSNIPIVDVVQDLVGGVVGSFSVDGPYTHAYKLGRTIVVTTSTGNDGTYTVLTDSTYDSVTDRTVIPVSEVVPSALVDGIIYGYGINMGGNNISDLQDPVDQQDCATRNYIENIVLGTILPILNSLVLPGSIVAWGSDIIPTGWYLCDGSAKTTAGDLDLFTAIGYQYGGGGITFNIPDLRGRFAIGLNPMPIIAADRIDRVQATTLGGISGSEDVAILTAEMPLHSHTGTALGAGSHSHSGSTGGGGSHSHTLESQFLNVDISLQQGPLPLDMFNTFYPLKSGLMDTVSNHSHSITGMSTAPNHTHSLSINAQGGAAAHENVSPYQIVNYIIKR